MLRKRRSPAAAPQAAAGSWVAVAAVARAHGLRGGVLLKAFTRDREELLDAPIERLHLLRDDVPTGDILTIESLEAHGDSILAHFTEIADRTAAEALRGALLAIPEAERWELPEGSWYIDDLLGMTLVDAASGAPIGTVLRIQEGAANDFLVFRTAHSPKEHLLPFIDRFAGAVDTKARTIAVTIPQGLLDL